MKETKQQGKNKFDRRGLLRRLAALGAGVVGLGAVSGCPGGSSYGKPGAGHGENGKTAAAGDAADAPLVFEFVSVSVNDAREVVINGRPAYLYHGQYDGDVVWTAVNRICTHAGCLVEFDKATQEFHCPCHNSVFDYNGKRLSGPAKLPLKTWPVSFKNTEVYVYPDGKMPAEDPA